MIKREIPFDRVWKGGRGLSPPQRFNGAFAMESALQGDCRRKRRRFLSCACTHFAQWSLCGGERGGAGSEYLTRVKFPYIHEYKYLFVCELSLGSGWRGGLMVSVLDSGSDGPGSSPGRGTALCSWARSFTAIVSSL